MKLLFWKKEPKKDTKKNYTYEMYVCSQPDYENYCSAVEDKLNGMVNNGWTAEYWYFWKDNNNQTYDAIIVFRKEIPKDE